MNILDIPLISLLILVLIPPGYLPLHAGMYAKGGGCASSGNVFWWKLSIKLLITSFVENLDLPQSFVLACFDILIYSLGDKLGPNTAKTFVLIHTGRRKQQ